MAENDLGFNPAAEIANEAIADEQLTLKKRARRRLVGAIALAFLAVIVLPMVMDQEPKPLTQDIQIRIPSQELSSVPALSRVAPNKPAATPASSAPAVAAATEVQPDGKPSPKADAKLDAKPETKIEPPKASVPNPPSASAKSGETKATEKSVEKSAEKPTAKSISQEPEAAREAARATDLLNAEQWIVQLGAYQDMANVKVLQGKIKGLGLPSFTEKVDTPQGPRTRVRSGPFDSREAAEKAHERLKKIGAGAPLGGIVAKK